MVTIIKYTVYTKSNVKFYTIGKKHKSFEFGIKVSIDTTKKSGVIVGALNFNSTEHDSKTLE